MLRISKLADYGAVAMNFLATHAEGRFSAACVAARVGLSAHTVSKVLKLFLEAGLVTSARGAGGGYRLARRPERITIAEVIAAVEGRPALTQCATDARCAHSRVCAVRQNWQRINQVVMMALGSVTLADMMRPLCRHPLMTRGINCLDPSEAHGPRNARG